MIAVILCDASWRVGVEEFAVVKLVHLGNLGLCSIVQRQIVQERLIVIHDKAADIVGWILHNQRLNVLVQAVLNAWQEWLDGGRDYTSLQVDEKIVWDLG